MTALRDRPKRVVPPDASYWLDVGGSDRAHVERLCMSDDENESRRNLRMPNDDEVFTVVTNMLGASRIRVRCTDGVERTARIPGRMQKQIWTREDDVVLVEPWNWQNERADVSWRYEKSETDQLRREGHIR